MQYLNWKKFSNYSTQIVNVQDSVKITPRIHQLQVSEMTIIQFNPVQRAVEKNEIVWRLTNSVYGMDRFETVTWRRRRKWFSRTSRFIMHAEVFISIAAQSPVACSRTWIITSRWRELLSYHGVRSELAPCSESAHAAERHVIFQWTHWLNS